MQGVDLEGDMESLARRLQKRVAAVLQEDTSVIEQTYNDWAHFKQGSSVVVRKVEYDAGDLLVTERYEAEVIGVDIKTGQLKVSRNSDGVEILLQHGRYRVAKPAS